MRIRIINGPNLNMLGVRQPEVYGVMDYHQLQQQIRRYAEGVAVDVEIMQSNYEGQLVDWLQQQADYDALIVNPAGYSHTSVAILDALLMIDKPKVEVHLTDIDARESFRRQKITALGVNRVIMGKHVEGYFLAIDFICQQF